MLNYVANVIVFNNFPEKDNVTCIFNLVLHSLLPCFF
uniref:Uncharacterized protein n=1 Tax=Rhizophora mucronata TaxID=61149 RepID=A0A2P2Q9L7_RHIMU